MTEDEEAEEIIKRLKKNPRKPDAGDTGYFYCPYIPLMRDGTPISVEQVEKALGTLLKTRDDTGRRSGTNN